MDKFYEPKKYEDEIYSLWLKSGFFNPDKLPSSYKKAKPYTVMIPPPNITGRLHMGHALNNTIQDILIRFYRMNGRSALWLPGTDHAGIATQNVVEKEIAKEGLTRQMLGREKFLERVWSWREKYGNLILEQLKKLGCSCDWSRIRFTLDEGYAQAVESAFIHYFKKGYLYRGPRIVNWCPRCETAISDIEVKYQEEKGKLWHIRYPLKIQNSKFKIQNSIIVATTRPETMLGDTAVAVNPKDERYKNLNGQKVILPIMNREISIISSVWVDSSFGTGAVKITPAHDMTDWKIGKENHLEIINVIGQDGKMTKEAGKFEGLSVFEARAKIIDELKSLDLLEKEEEYLHQISLCDRCSTPIEPQISEQWFVKMDKLAQPAKKVVEEGRIKIIPERYKKIYLDWLNKIEDWCVSRQLWWGHRLPVWLCQNGNLKSKIKNQKSKINFENIENWKSKIENSSAKRFVVSRERPQKCPFCGKCQMEQSTDVLDTWFSSALWPFATLGFPEKTKDLKKYYPTNFLSTAAEILYLWVARMIFSSLEFFKKIPFHEVYIHPTILTLEGKRMSKSKGIVVDPLDLIEKYGADATRLGIILQMSRDQQAIRFDERELINARNFVNKVWNITRFIEMKQEIKNKKSKIKNIKSETLADKWILSRLNYLIESTAEKIKNYQLGEAAREIYEFTWHEFADWYLEISKSQIPNPKSQNNTILILSYISDTLLKLLHPFIPFVTETIYQQESNNNLLMVGQWPKANKKFFNQSAEKEFKTIQEIVQKIRQWRQENKIARDVIPLVKIETKNEKIISSQKETLEFLTRVKLTLKDKPQAISLSLQ